MTKTNILLAGSVMLLLGFGPRIPAHATRPIQVHQSAQSGTAYNQNGVFLKDVAGNPTSSAPLNENQAILNAFIPNGNIRMAMFENENKKPTTDDKELERIKAAAKKIGLDGKWIVLNVENDGQLSKAQIGQQPDDVISIVPGQNNSGPLSMG